MGKQKDHSRHTSHKKKDKKIDKTSKLIKSNFHEGYLKNMEGVLQAELESIASAKKIGRKMHKELARYPLLAKAVYLGCEQAVDNILEAGENVNVQIPNGSTPLIIAVENGFSNIVQKLLKKGADPKLIRRDGRNALMIAVSKNDNRSFTFMWNYWDKSNFWELNHSDSKGYTALTIAAEHSNSQFMKFLLSINGVEVDKQTEEGRTALMFAVTAGQTNIVQTLLDSGADCALEDNNGATAICFAITQNRAEIKNLLIESLDNKSRDTYVKKRIELLSRPRTEDILVLIDFYKEILFRVILEIKRSFEDGMELLEKYKVFANLLKCLETHQHNTELLRIGFHLAVCLMYDKAEYSRYIVEELAEQYVSNKGTQFSLKMMHNYRLKSLCDLRGAAFLTIHAASECHSGKIWLKANYLQVLPFVKEFRMCFSTLAFWADGESVKAKIMFDRFVQILRQVEKEIKEARAFSPDVKAVKTETIVSATLNMGKDASMNTLSGAQKCVNRPSPTDGKQWLLVPNSKSSLNKSKIPSNFTATSLLAKKGTKKKKKASKLQTKLQHKIAVKKVSQQSSIKYTPELYVTLPAVSSDTNLPHTGYADALKRNLNNEATVNKLLKEEKILDAKEIDNERGNKKKRLKVSSYSWLNNNKCSSELQTDLASKNFQNENSGNSEGKVLKDFENQNAENASALDNTCKNVSPSADLMAFLKNMIHLNSKKDKNSDQTEPVKQHQYSDVVKKGTKLEDHDVMHPQNAPLRDILISMGLKFNSVQGDASENAADSKSKNERNGSGDAGNSKPEKTTPNGDPMNFLKDMLHLNARSEEDPEHILKQHETSESSNVQRSLITESSRKKGQNMVLHDILFALGLKIDSAEESNNSVINITQNKSEEAVIHECPLVKEQKKDSLRNIKKEEAFDCVMQEQNSRDMEMVNTENKKACNQKENDNCSSSESNCNESVSEKHISFCPKKHTLKISDDSYNGCAVSVKRKYEEICFQDLSFSVSRKEIKEANNVTLIHNPQIYANSYQFIFKSIEKTPANELERKTLKDKYNQNNFISKLNSCKIYFPDRISSPNVSLDLRSSSATFGIFSYKIPRNLNRPRKENLMPSVTDEKENFIPSVTDEKENFIPSVTDNFQIPKEQKNLLDLMTNAEFTDGNRDTYKKNQKYFLTSRVLFFENIQMILKINSSNLYKFVLLYQRLILLKTVCQFLKSNLDVKKSSCVHQYLTETNSVNCTGKKSMKECKNSKTSSNLNSQKILYLDRSSFSVLKEYSALINLKAEFSKFAQAALCYKQQKLKKVKFIRKCGIRASKITGNERNESVKFSQKSKKRLGEKMEKHVEGIFSNNFYGFKPQFINCQYRSKWYKVLHRIESCIPLASFFLGFPGQERSCFADCTMHELICSSGKIIYSSKDKHTLREGEYGTYIGLMADGNPVVVRQLQNSPNKALELLSMKQQVNHRNIATFYCLSNSPVEQKIFVVTELIEYSLTEYIKAVNFDGKFLVQELLEAVRYLHGKKVIHGFLKPSNVMVTIDHRLKVSGFYQLDFTPLQCGIVSKKSDFSAVIGKPTLSNFCWRPYELIAASSETEARKYLTTATDIQATGMLIYYILSKGKHPFGSSDLQCQQNILNGFCQLGPRPVDVESRDLIREMIKKLPSSRPNINLAARHPYLWDIERRFRFLVTVSRKIDFFLRKPTKFAEALQDSCIEGRNWTSYVDCKLLKYMSKAMNKTYIDYYADLLHFIVGIDDNFEIMPVDIKFLVHQPSLFISIVFPTIFMSVYCVVRDNPYVQMQMALQSYF